MKNSDKLREATTKLHAAIQEFEKTLIAAGYSVEDASIETFEALCACE